MRVRRILTLSPSDEAQWMKVYIRQFEDLWAAIICADDEAAPQEDQPKGIAFFENTAEEADQGALDYPRMQVGRH